MIGTPRNKPPDGLAANRLTDCFQSGYEIRERVSRRLPPIVLIVTPLI
jgi:hypothetical protein